MECRARTDTFSWYKNIKNTSLFICILESIISGSVMYNSEIDGRGSIGQIRIFEFIKDLYSSYTVLWEVPIVSLGLRFDIFVKELGIAIEVDGDQHNKNNSFFYKEFYDAKRAFIADQNKNDFAELNGIKMVRLVYKDALKMTKEELKKKIDSIDYPDNIYTYDCLR